MAHLTGSFDFVARSTCRPGLDNDKTLATLTKELRKPAILCPETSQYLRLLEIRTGNCPNWPSVAAHAFYGYANQSIQTIQPDQMIGPKNQALGDIHSPGKE